MGVAAGALPCGACGVVDGDCDVVVAAASNAWPDEPTDRLIACTGAVGRSSRFRLSSSGRAGVAGHPPPGGARWGWGGGGGGVFSPPDTRRVFLMTKPPASSAWWRMVTSI